MILFILKVNHTILIIPNLILLFILWEIYFDFVIGCKEQVVNKFTEENAQTSNSS